ncbi:RNA polymerase sigma factor [Oceanobacillus sp. Castelsardo]|uniref:RNA polymerase sigma factor n=1 Tax=Oceanobacillus sp. Castelsardo TaxID=1851204 RepID=UPI00083816E1|nr:RNA polymerase sigma factor [Oceanobacillus sp. Castelsardo]
MNLNKDTVPENAGKHEEYSLEKLFVTYQNPIYQFVYRYCQDEQLSMDIVQDTFVRFHKYKGNFDVAKSSMKTYLFRMAYQLMINRLKRRSRWKKLLPFLYERNVEQELPLEEKLTVQEAIQQLSDVQRAVILLTYYHDLTQKEIANILEIPLGTVKSRMHTSLKKLKGILEVDE